MNNERFFIATNPLFWIFSIVVTLIINPLTKIYQYSTIDDWITIWFRIDNWSDDALNRIISVNDNKPDKVPWYYKHKLINWEYGAKKAKEILNQRKEIK